MHIHDPLLQTYFVAGGQPIPAPQRSRDTVPGLAIAAYTVISGLGRLLGRLPGQLGGAMAAVGAWRSRRVARDELMGLDDVTLKDIGLPRSAIPYVVRTLGGRPAANENRRPVAA